MQFQEKELKKGTKFIFATILFIVLLSIDIQYGHLSYKLSNKITKYLQSQFEYGQEKGLIEYIFLIFSTTGDAICTDILTVLLFIISTNKIGALKLVTLNSIIASIGDFLKVIAIQPRPFYIDQDIKLDFCYTGYGDPSGHSSRGFIFYVILVDTLFFQKFKSQQIDIKQFQYQISKFQHFQQLYKGSKYIYNILLIIFSLFIFLLGLSRLYFGVHFLNQILIGWVIGGYILYIYYQCGLERRMDYFFNNVGDLQIKILQKLKYLLLYLLFSFGLFYISWILYNNNMKSNDIEVKKNQWAILIQNKTLCTGLRTYFHHYQFEYHDIQQIAIIFIPCYLIIFYQEYSRKYEFKFILIKVFHFIMFICLLEIIEFQSDIKFKLAQYGYTSENVTLIVNICFKQIYNYLFFSILLNVIPSAVAIFNQFIQRKQK